MAEERTIRSRTETVYRILTGSDNPHGMVRWFADFAGIGWTTAKRYIEGERVMPDHAVRSLYKLEDQARAMLDAQREAIGP